MAQINLETALQTINRAVTEHSSVTDAQLEDYMMELINSNGEIIDKQPLSRLRDFVYNYLVTNKASDLADLVNSFNPIAFTEFPYLDSAAFFSRSTAGGKQIEGNTATIKAFKGNTLAWNQLVVNGDFSNGSTGWSPYNVSTMALSVSNGIATMSNITGETVASADKAGIRQVTTIKTQSGTKYYITFDIKPSFNNAIFLFELYGNKYTTETFQDTNWHRCSNVFAQNSTGNAILLIKPSVGSMITSEAFYQVKNVSLYNLTLMFGAGNEPATAEEFEAMFPLDYYDYNAGSLLNNNMTHFVSSGTDASGFTFTDTLPIPITQLTGKLDGAGESVTIFPNGMRSAGAVYDVIEKVDGQWYGVVNIGVVDLSTLQCYRRTEIGSDSTVFGLVIPDKKINRQANVMSNLAYPKYTTYNRVSWNQLPDKYIMEVATTNQIGINDSMYTSESAFKTSLSGVMLNYELATPQRYLLDTEFQSLLDTYRVANNGTEMILPVNTSTPTTAPAAFDFEYRVIDNEVKRICVQNWGGNYVDGEITKYEASQVTSLGEKFKSNTTITDFDEFKYFVNVESLSYTTTSGQFDGCTSLKSITMPQTDKLSDLTGAFYNTISLEELDLTPLENPTLYIRYMAFHYSRPSRLKTIKFPSCSIAGTIVSSFRGLTALESIIIDGTLDFSNITQTTSAFLSDTSLTTITGTITGIKVSITFSSSPLTRASALVLINGLDTVSTTQTITFSETTYALLTSDDIAIATGKGWTVASA